MPTVKKYEPGQVARKTIPLTQQNVKGASTAEPYAALSKAGQSIAAFGEKGMGLAVELQERKDKAAAKEAYVTFGDHLRDLQNDYSSRFKKDAVGLTVEATKDVDTVLEKIAGELERDRQRELFRSLAYTRRGSFLDSQAVYESTQIKEWEIETSNIMADEAIQYATENYIIPGVIEKAKDDITVAITTAMKGSSKEVVDSMKEAKISKLHQAVINNMAVNNAVGAKEYYRKNMEEIDGPMRTGIENFLKEVGVKQASQKQADEIILSTIEYEDQLKAARKIKDPDVRDATVARIKARKLEADKIETDQRQDILDTEVEKILNIHKNNGSYEEALDIALNVPNGSDQLKLRNVASNLFMKEDTATYPDKFVEVMNRIDNRNHKKGPIGSINQLYAEYKPYLSNSDFDQIVKYWQAGGSIGGLKDSRVKAIYRNLTGKNPDENKTKAANYKPVWDHVVANLPEGKRPTDEEIKKLVIQAIVDGERQGGFGFGYGEDVGYLEAKRQGYENTWLPDVSGDERKFITNRLKAAGDPVSDFTIRLYKRIYILELPMTKELKDALSREE